jgi:hypothetical protein
MEDFGPFYGHLVHFMDFCYILWTLGIVRGNLLYFSPFWNFVPRKIWQPWSSTQRFCYFFISCQTCRAIQIRDQCQQVVIMTDWGRFYKAPFRPKSFRMNFNPSNSGQFSTPKTVCLNLSEWVFFTKILGFEIF